MFEIIWSTSVYCGDMDRFIRRPITSTSIGTSTASGREDPLQVALQSIFGFPSFRKNQREICEEVLNNKDMFIVMPTGGGKTLCYALPAVLSNGVTIVISPLLSLIEDQVSALLQLPSGGVPAAYLTSTCTPTMISSIMADLQRCQRGDPPYLKLLYITPERLLASISNKDFLHMLYNNEFLCRFIVDEAHCVSAWGHDFRKDYAKLDILKRVFPEVPIVCLTATAREKVSLDCLKILSIPKAIRISCGYDRPNLLFEVRDKPSCLRDTHKAILEYILQTSGATGIVYCMCRKETEELSDYLRDNKISSDYYHAGQTPRERKLVQQAWLKGDVKVVCATIAYGMGIDKPDVRFVLHMSVAKSLEGYYQEAGRAGRDGNRSECVLFYRRADISALGRLMAMPSQTEDKQERCRSIGRDARVL